MLVEEQNNRNCVFAGGQRIQCHVEKFAAFFSVSLDSLQSDLCK